MTLSSAANCSPSSRTRLASRPLTTHDRFMAAGQLSHQSAWRNAVHSGDGRRLMPAGRALSRSPGKNSAMYGSSRAPRTSPSRSPCVGWPSKSVSKFIFAINLPFHQLSDMLNCPQFVCINKLCTASNSGNAWRVKTKPSYPVSAAFPLFPKLKRLWQLSKEPTSQLAYLNYAS